MWKLKKDKNKILKKIRNTYYAEVLGRSTVHICQTLAGYACSTLTAKGMLSIYFKIAMDDEQMNKILVEFFDEVN